MVFEVEIQLDDDATAPEPDDIHDWILNGMKATVGEPVLIVVNPQ
jgi:hypothetical protein